MNPALTTGIMEVAKLGLQVYLLNMQLAGKSPEEIERIFQTAYAEFKANRPEDLPDV